MKSQAFLLFVVLHAVCSAQKAEYGVVNTFLKEELSGIRYDTIFIARDKLKDSETIRLYKQAYREFKLNDIVDEVWIIPKLEELPIDEIEVDELALRSLKDTVPFWRDTDFRINGINVENTEKMLRSNQFFKNHSKDENYILSLSQPLITKRGNYTIFQFYITTMSGDVSPIPKKRV